MEYGCIGEKLGHSFSREIHNGLTDYIYELKELAPDQVLPFLAARDFKAINVTIPYKQTVFEGLDFISEKAERIGAVNTIVNRDGKLYGYNTDYYGMKALLDRNGIVLSGKKVLILGSGGTSRTAAAVAQDMGAKEIYRVSRTAREDCITYQNVIKQHTDARIIINTTPVGMYPQVQGHALDIAPFDRLEAVADAVYNPLCSQFVLDAGERGLTAVGGLYMLVMQAVKAVEFFIGQAPDPAKAETVYNSLLRQKQNIVLIGMPACGKSSVGNVLAKQLGRRFVDTDALIVEKAGRPIPEIFATVGEGAFRDIESDVIRELSPEQGLVIATGGGAILRTENERALRQNGVIFFLDRPLEALCATQNRPLSSTREALEKRYNERIDRYIAAADKRIKVPDGIEDTAEMILKEWKI